MKLKDDPRMRYRGVPNWPPVWLERFGDGGVIGGEVGVLTHVGADPGQMRRNRIFVYITHENKPYIGSLLFDDPAFCRSVCSLLKQHIGKSIAELGDFDVSHTL
jgi:hypothetical protein